MRVHRRTWDEITRHDDHVDLAICRDVCSIRAFSRAFLPFSGIPDAGMHTAEAISFQRRAFFDNNIARLSDRSGRRHAGFSILIFRKGNVPMPMPMPMLVRRSSSRQTREMKREEVERRRLNDDVCVNALVISRIPSTWGEPSAARDDFSKVV